MILILAHEAGHFYVARRLGVRVEEFGFGFPPRIFSRVKNGVRYSFNILPLGGFVRIFGEHGEGEESPESFISRPARQKFFILGAGIAANIVIAWMLFSVGAAIGTPQMGEPQDGVPVSIVSISPDSPAARAGLRFGDKIFELRADNISLRVETEQQVRDFIDTHRGREIVLMVRRGNDTKEIHASPRTNPPTGEGSLGIGMGRLITVAVPWYWAPVAGAQEVGYSVVFLMVSIGGIFKELFVHGSGSLGEISGPVGIYFFSRDLSSLGVVYILRFIGMLSVNLAVFNVLPIPALDGGRIFFLLVEKVRRVRMNPVVENYAHTAGFLALLLLMVLVTYYDIVKLF